jgi:FKBP-type peptidyl-prolyl cis-trans isomerase
MFGDEIQRVTGRKDEYHEVEEFICNGCRFDHKEVSDWVIEGPRKFEKDSVINQNKYNRELQPVHIATEMGILKGRDQDRKKIMASFEVEMNKKYAKITEQFKSAGEDFLAMNKTKPGIITTASGLQYQVITTGKGPKPSATSNVKVHYQGTVPEGGIFDSSIGREPVDFVLNQVIPGWTEGIQLMNVGSKFKFFIPQELAYGENSQSPAIQPYSTLIFEVELLGIEK